MNTALSIKALINLFYSLTEFSQCKYIILNLNRKYVITKCIYVYIIALCNIILLFIISINLCIT